MFYIKYNTKKHFFFYLFAPPIHKSLSDAAQVSIFYSACQKNLQNEG